MQLHPNQNCVPGLPNFLYSLGNEKRFGGSVIVLVIYLWLLPHFVPICLHRDHLLMIWTWCHEFNLAIEEFPISRIISEPKNMITNFFLYSPSFFLLHPKILFLFIFFSIESYFLFSWSQIMIASLTLLTTKNCRENFHFPSNSFFIS